MSLNYGTERRTSDKVPLHSFEHIGYLEYKMGFGVERERMNLTNLTLAHD